MPNITYPFDPTGLAASNLIEDELHTLTEINARTYRILIPKFAPFHLDNLYLEHVDDTGSVTLLNEDIDYYLVLPYIGASRSIGKMVYGGISINNNYINGVIRVRYQTLGGEWTADADYVLQVLAETVYNPRITVWDVVTNKTNQFPPINHDDHLSYVYGEQELVAAINSIADKIGQSPNPQLPIIQHLIDSGNPHLTTASQVGLGDVVNLPVASNTEVATHQHVNKYVTLDQVLTLLGL